MLLCRSPKVRNGWQTSGSGTPRKETRHYPMCDFFLLSQLFDTKGFAFSICVVGRWCVISLLFIAVTLLSLHISSSIEPITIITIHFSIIYFYDAKSHQFL
jgi:hypothetical protein